MYQRGGSIIPKKMRVRRSSTAMANDPYTLVVALDTPKSAAGKRQRFRGLPQKACPS